MIPAPLMINVVVGLVVIAKALAPGLNTMLFTSTELDSETEVMEEVLNVAVADGSFGTTPVSQLLVPLQSPEAGFDDHICADAGVPSPTSNKPRITVRTALRMMDEVVFFMDISKGCNMKL